VSESWCRARTLLRKTASGEAEGDLSNTPEQQLLNEHGQDLNAAISAAWRALPENLRTEYKQRAQALKVGSAPPPEATARNTGAPPQHTSAHVCTQAQATGSQAPAPAPPAAIDIASSIRGLDNDGEGAKSAVNSGPAAPGGFATQPSVQPAAHNLIYTALNIQPVIAPGASATDTTLGSSVDKYAVSGPNGTLPSGAESKGDPQLGVDIASKLGNINDVEGSELGSGAADTLASSLVPAPCVDAPKDL
jgi:hypothetical protein